MQERDAAALDLQMPGDDGTAVIETHKQNHKFIVNIIPTIYTAADVAAEWVTPGTCK